MYQFLIWGLASIPSPVRNKKEEKERCVVDVSIRLVWWLWKDKTYFYFQTWYFLLYCRFIPLIKSFNYQSKFYLSVLSRKFRELLSKKLPLDRGLGLSQTNALVTSKLQLPPHPCTFDILKICLFKLLPPSTGPKLCADGPLSCFFFFFGKREIQQLWLCTHWGSFNT